MQIYYVTILVNYMQHDLYKTCVYMNQQVKWLMKMKLGGWMVMDLSGDDFSGTFCNAGKYPLISRLNAALKGEFITMS